MRGADLKTKFLHLKETLIQTNEKSDCGEKGKRKQVMKEAYGAPQVSVLSPGHGLLHSYIGAGPCFP